MSNIICFRFINQRSNTNVTSAASNFVITTLWFDIFSNIQASALISVKIVIVPLHNSTGSKNTSRNTTKILHLPSLKAY